MFVNLDHFAKQSIGAKMESTHFLKQSIGAKRELTLNHCAWLWNMNNIYTIIAKMVLGALHLDVLLLVFWMHLLIGKALSVSVFIY